jgi:hypothetical protein
MPDCSKSLDLAVPRDAQFVMASWSVRHYRSEPALFQEVRRSLQNLRKVTALDGLV